MKYFIWILSSFNLYFGVTSFLNVIGVLQDSKYSTITTIVFAILFLAMAIGGFYFSIWKADNKTALWISIGPWLLALIVLLFSMFTGDYK